MAGDYVKNMKVFQGRLREAMNREKMTQEKLAESVGIAQSGISEYLNGQRSPKIKTLRALASALSVDPAWLMGLDKETESTRILDKFYTLTPFDRAKVEGYMDSLLNNAREAP